MKRSNAAQKHTYSCLIYQRRNKIAYMNFMQLDYL